MAMDGYTPLNVSSEQLRALAGSVDHDDRMAAAREIQSLAESKRSWETDIDIVVTCVSEGDAIGSGEKMHRSCVPVRCFTMAAEEIGRYLVPSDKPFGSCLGSMIQTQMGSTLQGRLVLLSDDGQLLWQDEPSEVRAVLRTLARDTDQRVLVATVAALVAVISADDGELSSSAIEELYRLVLRGAVPDMEVIAGAFEAIKAAAERGNSHAVDVFLESLKHDACKVRLFAAVGLEAPAKAGDERALAGLLRSVWDAAPEVRQAALDGLGSALAAAEKGCDAPGMALAAQAETLLKMLERETCAELVVLLGAAAGKGHTVALEKLLGLTHESEEEIASSAVRGLGVAAMQGATDTAEALSALAEIGSDEHIRLQAVSSMGAMVHDGHHEIAAGLARIATNVDDPDLFVRLEAVKGLGPAVSAGSTVATNVLLELLSEPSVMIMIRRGAVELITTIIIAAEVLELFSLESRGLLAAVTALHDDKDVMIRRAVVSCLCSLSSKGQAAAKAIVISASAKDSDEHVRRAAVHHLGQLAEAGDGTATEAVLGCVKDRSSFVRAEVASCVASLAKLGHTKAMELLPALEEDGDLLVSVGAQPGTRITSDVGDAVSVVKYSYEASRLIHHGLAACSVPMLHAAVVPGAAEPESLANPGSHRALTDLMQGKLEFILGGNVESGTA